MLDVWSPKNQRQKYQRVPDEAAIVMLVEAHADQDPDFEHIPESIRAAVLEKLEACRL